MDLYEVLILAIPEITTDEASALEVQFKKTIEGHKGSLLIFDRWGKYNLAYPVRKNDYGIYFLARFEVDSANRQELLFALRPFFAVKHHDLIMRHMVARLESASLAYQRPESLEEVPGRGVDSLLQDKKLAGITEQKFEEIDVEG